MSGALVLLAELLVWIDLLAVLVLRDLDRVRNKAAVVLPSRRAHYCRNDLQCHGKSPLLGIRASKRHPSDVQRMRECAECLRPHDAEILYATPTPELGEDAIENVTEEMAAEACHDGFATSIAVVNVISLGD